MLDEISRAPGALRSTLEAIHSKYLEAIADDEGLDWRYYFVKYAVMREGDSGIYVASSGSLDYDVCMLRKTQMNGYYRDPYLLAIHRESGVLEAVEDAWFIGYETSPRWMSLATSGAGLRCVSHGIALQLPPDAAHAATFGRVIAEHGVGNELVLVVPQVERDGRQLDTRDRVQMGAALLRDLVAAGL